jgi:hypothetical protein
VAHIAAATPQFAVIVLKSGFCPVQVGHWCLRRKEVTADNQIPREGHYFAVATLNRKHRWMALDCRSNYYIPLFELLGPLRYTVWARSAPGHIYTKLSRTVSSRRSLVQCASLDRQSIRDLGDVFTSRPGGLKLRRGTAAEAASSGI